MLSDCVRKCLLEATKERYKSVAMTALGIGRQLNYPPEFVAKTLINTVADFLEQERTSIESVEFVVHPSDNSSYSVSVLAG
jgi:O-acetyl-ADP-ribose deacetylase (regulator of RNase III)